MIYKHGNYYLISTEKTSLLLYVNELGKLSTEYYGRKISEKTSFPSLTRQYPYGIGTSVLYDEKKSSSFSLDFHKSEFSTPFKSDYNLPSIILSGEESSVFDFVFTEDTLRKPQPIPSLPMPHGGDDELILSFADPLMRVSLRLHYITYPKSDVIGRFVEITNLGEKKITILKVASFEITLVNHLDSLCSTYGAWAAEGFLDETRIPHGQTILSSDSGSSSNRHNPFFFVKEKGCGRDEGNAYGFNLVYSGNFEASLELDAEQYLHIQEGIASRYFSKDLKQGESFFTPMAIMSHSYEGTARLALNMQHFVRDSVSPEAFAYSSRPVIYNNWEATCFDFKKGKIFSLMKKAAELGAELFVLDDGWFGNRNDDSHGLGDWTVNEKKLPGGLKALSDHAKSLGLKFGIWMEPEMVNSDAKVYKDHPDWVIHDGVHEPSVGRHQYVLNLGLKEVQDFVYSSVKNVLSSADISYLKWDMNRPISDVPFVSGFNSFYFDYIVGIYAVLNRLTKEFPSVLMENCASGGNRFDLGMLSYFAQSWMSDDTDSFERTRIQSTFSYGYPLSVFSNHVAAKVSNQLLRLTSFDTKFDVSAFGILGYELDLDDLTPLDTKIIKNQIAFYKKHRILLQNGDFILIQPFDEDEMASFEAISEGEAIVGQFRRIASINPVEGKLFCLGLEDNKPYSYKTRQETIDFRKFGSLVNYVSPIHLSSDGALLTIISNRKGMEAEIDAGVAEGAAFSSGGVTLAPEWMGTGYDNRVRLLGDFGARLYYIKKD